MNPESFSSLSSHQQQHAGSRSSLSADGSSLGSQDLPDQSDSETSEVILSIMWFGGMLGAAYYDVGTGEMQLLPDQAEVPPAFAILHTLIRQLEPTCIIGSSKTDDRIVRILKDASNQSTNSKSNTSSGDSSNSYKEGYFHLQSSLDFAYESCKYRLLHLEMPAMAGRLSEQEKRIYMTTLLDFNKTCMVRAAGGLLKFLEKRRIGVELEDSSKPFISRISIFSLKNIVAVDDNTFSALQILPAIIKPSFFEKVAAIKEKEKLSLYGVFNRCKSFVGRKEFRRWFVQPTNDLDALKKRHQVIQYFLAGQNVETMQSLQVALRSIKIVQPILARMWKAQATLYDWQRLYRTAYNSMLIGDICRSITADVEIFREIGRTFTPDLFKIASLIYTIIDFDQSMTQNHFVVKPGIDDQLDQKKRTYNGLPHFMTQVAQRELQNLQDDIQECSVMYIPQLGYLLSIPETETMKQTNDYALENLQYMFVSNGVAYYKSAKTLELDRLLGDTLCEITDDETEIMHKLQNVILDMSEVLYNVMKYCAQLDCLISLAVVAKEFNFVKPEISDDGIISVTKGRHPLQELCSSTFVPNDFHSSEQHGKIKVITGPNASGKSVYLKQVAVIVYLAHIGCFVPAENAKITLVDSIYSRIQITESISANMSGFCQELAQVSKALNHATGRSLVVVDEFGKGTNSDSGVPLVASALVFWLQRGAMCPHVLFATHYHSLHEYLPTHNLLKYQTMETIQNKKDIVCLYRLADGRATASFGRNIAYHTKIPRRVLQREEQISELMRKGEVITPRDSSSAEEQYNKFTSVTRAVFQMDVSSCDMNSIHHLIIESRFSAHGSGTASPQPSNQPSATNSSTTTTAKRLSSPQTCSSAAKDTAVSSKSDAVESNFSFKVTDDAAKLTHENQFTINSVAPINSNDLEAVREQQAGILNDILVSNENMVFENSQVTPSDETVQFFGNLSRANISILENRLNKTQSDSLAKGFDGNSTANCMSAMVMDGPDDSSPQDMETAAAIDGIGHTSSSHPVASITIPMDPPSWQDVSPMGSPPRGLSPITPKIPAFNHFFYGHSV